MHSSCHENDVNKIIQEYTNETQQRGSRTLFVKYKTRTKDALLVSRISFLSNYRLIPLDSINAVLYFNQQLQMLAANTLRQIKEKRLVLHLGEKTSLRRLSLLARSAVTQIISTEIHI